MHRRNAGAAVVRGRGWLAVEKLEQEEVEMYEERRAGGGRGEEEEKAGRQGERRGLEEEPDEEKGMTVKGCWWGRRGWKESK